MPNSSPDDAGRFGNSVSIENKTVARLQIRRHALICALGKDAQHESVFFYRLHPLLPYRATPAAADALLPHMPARRVPD